MNGEQVLRELPGKVTTVRSRRRVPIILQGEASECGLAAFAMVSSYYGREIALRALRQRYRVSRDGLSLFQLINIAGENGFCARPVKLDLGHLRQLQTPAILFWNKMHFVVLESTTAKGIHIVDPGVGRRFFSWEDALPLFSNAALELTPVQGFQPNNRTSQANRLDFSTIVRSNPWIVSYLIPMALMAIVIHIGSIAAPKLFSLAIDEVVGKNDEELMYLLLYIFGGLFLFKSAAHWLRTWLDARLRVGVTYDLSGGVIAHLLRLPISYFERRTPADILRRTQAVDNAYMQFSAGSMDIAINGVFAIVFICLMAFIDQKLAFFSLLLCIAFVIFRLLNISAIEKRHLASIEAETKRNGALLGAIGSMESTKLYGYEFAKVSNWCNEQAETETARAGVELSQKMTGVAHEVLSHSQSLLVTALGVVAVLRGDTTIGQLIAFVFYKDLLLECVQKIVNDFVTLRIIKTDLKRVEDITDEKPEPISEGVYCSDPLQPRERIRSIQVKDASFRYGSFEEPVLDNADLLVEAHSRIAIIGSSGSGKSTLLKIMSGLYALEEGQLLINGIPLENFGLRQYRSGVAYVAPTEEIIHGTVSDNIIMDGNLDAARLKTAVEQAGLWKEVLALSNGFNTLLGPMGVKLSSGQKQRLLIARALYRNPDVIFFDEPTSHLDPDARDVIIETLRALPMTVIVVTHDMALLQACDKAYRVVGHKLESMHA